MIKLDVVLHQTMVPVNGDYVAVPRVILRRLAASLRRRANQQAWIKLDGPAESPWSATVKLLDLNRATARRCAKTIDSWANNK